MSDDEDVIYVHSFRTKYDDLFNQYAKSRAPPEEIIPVFEEYKNQTVDIIDSAISGFKAYVNEHTVNLLQFSTSALIDLFRFFYESYEPVVNYLIETGTYIAEARNNQTAIDAKAFNSGITQFKNAADSTRDQINAVRREINRRENESPVNLIEVAKNAASAVDARIREYVYEKFDEFVDYAQAKAVQVINENVLPNTLEFVQSYIPAVEHYAREEFVPRAKRFLETEGKDIVSTFAADVVTETANKIVENVKALAKPYNYKHNIVSTVITTAVYGALTLDWKETSIVAVVQFASNWIVNNSVWIQFLQAPDYLGDILTGILFASIGKSIAYIEGYEFNPIAALLIATGSSYVASFAFDKHQI
jgi:outer membrane murein-binding lipoprotein Lpp